MKKPVANSSEDFDPSNCSSTPTFFYETVFYDLEPSPSYVVDIHATYDGSTCTNSRCTTTFALNAQGTVQRAALYTARVTINSLSIQFNLQCLKIYVRKNFNFACRKPSVDTVTVISALLASVLKAMLVTAKHKVRCTCTYPITDGWSDPVHAC